MTIEASDLGGENVKVEFEDGIAWVKLNRPDKRNAMSVGLAEDMIRVLDALEIDDRAGVVILTGEGDAFSAGMDLKDFFRATDGGSDIQRMRAYRSTRAWQWRLLMHYAKPTIAMVNGWCFGGAFTPLICCDLAIASEDAVFGLSEINWGVIPGGVVSKAISTLMNDRKAMYYVMTGEKFGGKMAEQLGLVNEAVPAERLRERTVEIARVLLEKNPTVLRQARMAYKYVREMSWEESAEYLTAKADQTTFVDPEKGREKGLSQFLDTKTYRPGHGAYKREE
ncbi:p-hydroxycinnamoyl CoA hydratase/lyase [Neorhizobium galegae]|uniref:p-hydroxycinnamoyl CoA hydratase/lyase n=1 Tax=Neorhizobium galegae TaxID=399 RepID=UPI000620F370|nr:p-hydroxycinnamoyl CoA hydratase/lyase [Neorhizobium galegae]CDZ60329.1 P-hydroxycinnamoyl CoA hydratase/lyase [Neorhizobium galegae bv. orientalis]KAB1120930.1 p-hydroxycinnamoyl CoA hydratase/lyase [Neorhizobium galegae]MCQ1574486.1 p-hydroxycinnamoyl CoA hydratase/lyase [Neorhizobium galegae]MCQ1810341.1 p-hydroxycinnamoyl CoA hydratase/lyase [Neorhizobium galegae]MCQ1838913.1 p-hydroxycinnamoyl CoA hydratase/lyase [Neorhizobium galegae]